jgi:hypothetical protein
MYRLQFPNLLLGTRLINGIGVLKEFFTIQFLLEYINCMKRFHYDISIPAYNMYFDREFL